MAQTLTLVGLAGGGLWEPDQGIHLTADPSMTSLALFDPLNDPLALFLSGSDPLLSLLTQGGVGPAQQPSSQLGRGN